MCVVARDEEGGVPRAVEERGGGQAKIGAGDGDGGVTEEEAVAAEVGEVGGAEEAGPAAADEGEGGEGGGGHAGEAV